MSNSLDGEQRTENIKEKALQFPALPSCQQDLLLPAAFFPSLLSRDTHPFLFKYILQSLYWIMSLPISSEALFYQLLLPITPLTPPFQLKSLLAKDKNLLWIPIIPVATLHLAFPSLMDFPKGTTYLLDSCFAPLPTDNPTSILPRKFMKQKILKNWNGNFSHQIITILLIDSTSVAISLFKPHLLKGMWEVGGKTWVLLPLGFHSGEGNGTPLQYSCLENPWMEESGGLQSMGSLRLWATERLHFHFSLSCIGEGNGNPLQRSCLENPRDGGAWWAAVYGVTQSWTRLKRLSSSSLVSMAFTSNVAPDTTKPCNFSFDVFVGPMWLAHTEGRDFRPNQLYLGSQCPGHACKIHNYGVK